MRIGGLEFDIDVSEVLDECGLEYRRRGDNYWLCCTNHEEDTASLSIDSERFIFNCFGCGYSGNIIKFLVDNHPDIDTPLQAHTWLYRRYPVANDRKLVLDFETPVNAYFCEEELRKYDIRHPYLYRRGFKESVLQAFRIGYVEHEEFILNEVPWTVKYAITIPWFDRKGNCIFIQYRPLTGSTKYIFRCGKDEKKSLLYGLNIVTRNKIDQVVLVEGAFDCIWLWQHNIPAVAIGSARISDEQVEQLAISGVRKVDLFLDNDKAGEVGTEIAKQRLNYFRLREVIYPENIKDANDLSSEQISELQFTPTI